MGIAISTAGVTFGYAVEKNKRSKTHFRVHINT